MTKIERDTVIDACILRVLSLRDRDDTRDPADQEAVETITGAACFHLLQYRSEPMREKPARTA